jgi:hypothetical protein
VCLGFQEIYSPLLYFYFGDLYFIHAFFTLQQSFLCCSCESSHRIIHHLRVSILATRFSPVLPAKLFGSSTLRLKGVRTEHYKRERCFLRLRARQHAAHLQQLQTPEIYSKSGIQIFKICIKNLVSVDSLICFLVFGLVSFYEIQLSCQLS